MSAESSCPSEQELRQLLLGELLEGRAEALEEHVSRCDRCGTLIDHLPAEDTLVAALREGSPILEGPEQPVIQGLISRMRRPGGLETAAVVSPLPARLPERIGYYRVLEVLGHGGMGVVYLAVDERLKRRTALKMILAGPHASPERLARFRREAEVVARLGHPNIVQIYEIDEHDGQPFLAMEYVEGGSLAQKLASGPLPARDAAGLGETLARAIHAAHEKGVVHRDLKPGNILLQRKRTTDDTDNTDKKKTSPSLSVLSVSSVVDFVPKITDFGLAKTLGPADEDTPGYVTQSGAVVGTPGYMAPEQILVGESPIGPAADVYALGAILYECLTARPPFRAATVLETLEQAYTQDPVPPRQLQPGTPRDLETICLRCLQKEARRRYPSALALADDLRRFLDGRPIVARPVSIPERLWKWARRRPALAALAGVSLLALAGLAVYHVQLQRALHESETYSASTRREKDRADANYQEARETLQRIVTRFEDKRLAEVPRLQELRRDVLENALAFYQRALKEADSADPAVRFDTAVAHEQAGKIQALLGQRDQAEANVRRAGDLFEQLAAESPNDVEVTAHLAVCLDRLGQLCIERAGPGVHAVKETVGPSEKATLDEAEGYLRRSLKVREGLLRAEPGRRRWQQDVAAGHQDLAGLYFLMRQRNLAEEHYDRALGLLSALYAEDPADRQGAAALGRVCNQQATFLSGRRPEERRRPLEQVEALYRRAETLLQPLTEPPVLEADLVLELAEVYANWGNLVWGRGSAKFPADRRPEQALDLYGRAIVLLEAYLRREPQDARARNILVNTCNGRAYLFEAEKRYADSLKDWDRAVELSEGAHRAFRRANRAHTLARAGEHVRAAAEAAALVENPEGSDLVLFNAAGAYSVAQQAARADVRLSADERQSVADGYAARAVAVLRQLQASGFFRAAEHRPYLKGFESLRGRADFQQLLREVEAAPADKSP